MSFATVKAPSNWLASWSEDGTNITLPIASIPGLTAVEADGASGDIRNTLYPLLETLYAKWLTVAEADRPTKMTIYRNSVVDDLTNKLTRQYTFTFTTDISGEEVSAE